MVAEHVGMAEDETLDRAPWNYETLKVVETGEAGEGWGRLVLEAPRIAETASGGQFVLLGSSRAPEVGRPYLKHPFYIAEIDAARGRIAVVYDRGARLAAEMRPWQVGSRVGCIGPLGHGFPTVAQADGPLLLVAAGYGVVAAAVAYATQGDRPAEAWVVGVPPLSPDWSAVSPGGRPVQVAPSLGRVLEEAGRLAPAEIWAAGPPDLVKGVASWGLARGKRCFAVAEAPIACGVGACLGCTSAGDGTWRVCREGPVVPAEWLKGVGR